MIEIKNKSECVGCNACVQRCPEQCISINEDEQGFIYPRVNLDKCINCNLCKKVCPVINQTNPKEPMLTYAAKNKDITIQNTSSSGGVFFALVEYVIKEKRGVVFGAKFEKNWHVVHDYAETLEDAKAFKSSKYVQSKIGDNFKKVENFLKAGRTVLFSGTPCQIAGLRLFLKKDYKDQLLLIDFVCHGVPSPKIWQDYLGYISSINGFDPKNIIDLNFRDKRKGWANYGMRICYKNESTSKHIYIPNKHNTYMQGFLMNFYLRPSCYICPTKCGKSNSDITLGDFWGISKFYPLLNDNNYHSLILINNDNGEQAISKISILKEKTSYNDAISINTAIKNSSLIPHLYNKFWEDYNKKGLISLFRIVKSMRPSLFLRIIGKIKKSTIFKIFYNINRSK